MKTRKPNFRNKPYHKRPYRRKPAQRSQGFDVSKYVNRAVTQEEEPPYETQHGFEDFGVDQRLLAQVRKVGYTTPTEIQDKSIPYSLEGRDVIGVAGTGTGKTAAFLIPTIHKLLADPQDQSVLVITPTRELASQVTEEFKKLTRGLRLYSCSLIGGVSVESSIRALRRTNQVIIGTPGRLMDMIRRGLLRPFSFKTLILDEFDRMLDMGFLPDITSIIDGMDSKEQTLLFSATMDRSQAGLLKKICPDAVQVRASRGTKASSAIDQEVLRIPRGHNKIDYLLDVISGSRDEKVILFCETKRLVNEVWHNLHQNRISADTIHGDKTQKARETALRKFKRGYVNVLIATDVLARGIDVNDVSLVINYEVPRNYNDYIHRIGRTGRAGKPGRAITLID